MWSISHHKGYCSRLSTVQPPHPFGLSCGATLPGRRPPPGLCTGSPVTGCFHGSGFTMVPDAAWPGSDQWPWSNAPAPGPVGRPGRPGVSNPWSAGSFLSLGRPTCARCPGPLGSCSPVCSRGLMCCVCGVLGHLAPVQWCARSVWCVACAVSRASCLPFAGVTAGCVVLRVRCPGPLGSCSPVRLLGVLLCVRGVLGNLAPAHRCACSVFCFVFAVSWATWLLFTGAPARCVALRARCPG